MYLHVLARLEGLAADGAGVKQRARRVHVGYVLLEVAVVAVQLAALGAGGLAARLTVAEGAGAGRGVAPLRLAVRAAPAAPAARPRRSWGRRRSRSVLASPIQLRLSLTAHRSSLVFGISRSFVVVYEFHTLCDFHRC